MNKQPSSIDGFTPHRAGGQAGQPLGGSIHNPQPMNHVPVTVRPARRKLPPQPPMPPKMPGLTKAPQSQPVAINRRRAARQPAGSGLVAGGQPGLRRPGSSQAPNAQRQRGPAKGRADHANQNDIAASLAQIDLNNPGEPRGKKRKTPEQLARRKKIIKWSIITALLVALAVGGYIIAKTLMATDSVFKGGVFDFAQKAQLKMDENGRSNILIFGTSEDSDGGQHPGAELTDSIMVLSIDQNKKSAAMISVPRDLWVKLDTTCAVGRQAKINTVYMCASNSGKNEAAGAEALQKKVGEVLGLKVQYYAHLNYKVVSDTVNAVGGVDVKIETSDPRGIYDPNFDWRCNYQCKMVYYKNGQVAHLDGDHALALARARNAQGGYGLPGGNFDRERNQQKIIRALQEKALSAGTLANIGKITSLVDAFGSNLRTNFEKKEVRTLVDLGNVVKGDKLRSIALDKDGEAVLTDGNHAGQSVVMPVAGLFNYTKVQAYITKQLLANELTKESARVDIYNGSGVAGKAQLVANDLQAKGFTVGAIGNAPVGDYGKAKVYQVGEGNEATKKKLQQLYGTTVETTKPPVTTTAETKFVVIVGKELTVGSQ